MSPTRLLLVRHGERADLVDDPGWRAIRHAAVRPKDPPLTVQGRQQAAQAARRIGQSAPQARVIYCSPLRRCLETAAEIAHCLDLPIIVVVSLAKRCSYFRKCALKGEQPLYAGKEEAGRILRESHEDVRLIGYEEDDGLSSRKALEKICLLTNEECLPEAEPQVIVVSHCESQKEMAVVAGVTRRFKTPYCCTAIFEVTPRETSVEWSLVSRPLLCLDHSPICLTPQEEMVSVVA